MTLYWEHTRLAEERASQKENKFGTTSKTYVQTDSGVAGQNLQRLRNCTENVSYHFKLERTASLLSVSISNCKLLARYTFS